MVPSVLRWAFWSPGKGRQAVTAWMAPKPGGERVVGTSQWRDADWGDPATSGVTIGEAEPGRPDHRTGTGHLRRPA